LIYQVSNCNGRHSNKKIFLANGLRPLQSQQGIHTFAEMGLDQVNSKLICNAFSDVHVANAKINIPKGEKEYANY